MAGIGSREALLEQLPSEALGIIESAGSPTEAWPSLAFLSLLAVELDEQRPSTITTLSGHLIPGALRSDETASYIAERSHSDNPRAVAATALLGILRQDHLQGVKHIHMLDRATMRALPKSVRVAQADHMLNVVEPVVTAIHFLDIERGTEDSDLTLIYPPQAVVSPSAYVESYALTQDSDGILTALRHTGETFLPGNDPRALAIEGVVRSIWIRSALSVAATNQELRAMAT